MPTTRTRRARNAQSLNYDKLSQLIDGKAYLLADRTGYLPKNATGGCNHWTEADWADWEAQIRKDWRSHGAEILSWWRGENERFTAIYGSVGGKQRDPSITPWAQTKFGDLK